MSTDMSLYKTSYSVRVLPMYPLSIVSGGFERIAIETTSALQRLGINTEYLEWISPDSQFDILHLFGPASYWHDLLQQGHNRFKIVLSTIAGSHGRFLRYTLVSYIFAWAGRYIKQQTIFGQYRQGLHWTERVICSNELEGQFFSHVFGVPEGKLAIIPNGVAKHFFSPDPEPFSSQYNRHGYVLFVGNIVERKNPLLLASTLIRMQIPGVFIGGVFASEQEYGQRFRRLIQSASNLLWIENLGYNDPLLSSAYSNAGVFCLPSIVETQPLSAMEAMAAQLPIVLADLPYAHQPPFESVIRCKPNNTSSLEEALLLALRQPDAYRQKLPNYYTWEEVAGKIARLYREILVSKD